jgi:uncharacterized protein
MKMVLVAVGWLCFAIGVAAIFVPLVPTTPFLILSAFLFSKGSPRLHQWMRAHPQVGPVIVNWEKNHSIPLYAKILATTLVSISATGMWVFAERAPIVVRSGVSVFLAMLLLYIWTRRTA